MRHLKTIILTVILLFSINITTTATELSEPVQMDSINENDSIEMKSFNSGLGVETHTEQEIRQFLKNNNVYFYEPTSYKTEPSITSPYMPGSLSTETLNNALKMINNIRYIAGLNANITLNEEYNQIAQAASLINCINNELTHYPSKPESMDDTLYNLCYQGASHSNISKGCDVTNLLGYMNDTDFYSAASGLNLGHRRWILNPPMIQTGFGQAGDVTAMYAIDNNGSGSQKNIIWPASEMPLEYFGYGANAVAWSINTGNTENINNITVTLTRLSDNKTWNFHAPTGEGNDGYFNVDNQGYGITGCISFLPKDIAYSDGDRFHVTITGTTNGTIEYDVHFFSLIEDFNIGSDLTLEPDTKVYKSDILSITPEYISRNNTPDIWREDLNNEFTWETDNHDVIDIQTYYLITKPYGIANLTVTHVPTGMQHTITIKVADGEDFTLSETNVAIKPGDTKKVKVTVTPAKYTMTEAGIWCYPSNTSIIDAWSDGIDQIYIQGRKKGKAEVIVRLEAEDITKNIKVTVSDNVKPTPTPTPTTIPDPDPTPEPTPVVVETYDSYITNLEPAILKSNTTVTKWTSSSPSIVTIKKSGKKSCSVTGNASGTATITGYNNNNAVIVYNVTVEIPKLNAQSLRKKNTYNVNEWISGINACRPTRFESSDPKILKVNKTTGEVKALKKGKAKITVYFGNGKISKKYSVK